MGKAVFFDRDGIINAARVMAGNPHPPSTLLDTHIMPGIADVLSTLRLLDYKTICITNQPDVARGTQTKEEVEKINSYLREKLVLTDILTCYHDNSDNCSCRKPEIGMFLYAQNKHDIDLSKSWMIGDRKKDIDAGKNAGCKTIFVDYNYSESKPTNADFIIKNVKDILKIIGDEMASNEYIKNRVKLFDENGKVVPYMAVGLNFVANNFDVSESDFSCGLMGKFAQIDIESIFRPKQVIYNGRYTTCMWQDGTVTVVRATEDENAMHEHGVAMCIVKKLFGSRNQFLKTVKNGKVYKPKVKKVLKLEK